VSNIHGGSGPIQRKNLQLPFDWNGRWQVALGFVASLVLKLSCNREDFPILSKRSPELGSGVYLDILADAESSIKDGYALVDDWQKESF
jgi:hypothetical protein